MPDIFSLVCAWLYFKHFTHIKPFTSYKYSVRYSTGIIISSLLQTRKWRLQREEMEVAEVESLVNTGSLTLESMVLFLFLFCTF